MTDMKICGDCVNWSQVVCDIGVCSIAGTSVGEEEYFEARNEFDYCRHPESFDWHVYALQERYEKLEQAAREMLTYIACIKVAVSPLQLTRDTATFRDKLRECGVSVDE